MTLDQHQAVKGFTGDFGYIFTFSAETATEADDMPCSINCWIFSGFMILL